MLEKSSSKIYIALLRAMHPTRCWGALEHLGPRTLRSRSVRKVYNSNQNSRQEVVSAIGGVCSSFVAGQGDF